MENASIPNVQIEQNGLTECNDVTHLLQHINEYNKALMHGGLVTKTDPAGIITFVSKRFSDLTGYLPEELIGQSHALIRHPNIKNTIFKDLWRTITKKEIWSGVMQNIKRNGETFFAHTTVVPILDISGEIVEFISMRHDISDLITGRKGFRSSYKIDVLTGLGNRTKLLDDIQMVKTPMLALINISHFKEVNDTYGVESGDCVLEQLADLFQSECLKHDIEAYRLNGDEFALLGGETHHAQYFKNAFVGLGKSIESTPFIIGTDTIKLKVNIGISLGQKDALLHAGIALKESKKNHRLFSVADHTSVAILEYKNNLIWKQKIIDGITEDRFVPFYQPIINNITGQIESYETLIRLIDKGDVISPAKFLEIAKYANIYSELTRIMIRKTFQYFHYKESRFSLNLNIEDIQNIHTRLYLKKMLYLYTGIQNRLTIELVESEGIENFDEIIEFINEMKNLGCQIAIDDFGTGYSNFEYLMKMNVDVIKIDGSLIRGMIENKKLYNVVESIVQLAQKNNIKIIAEFVSSAEIYDKVKGLGIEYSQGYYFKEPTATTA